MKPLFLACSLALSLLVAGCAGNSAEEPLVTFKEYQQIKTGMTLTEVEAIIGGSGDRRGGSDTSDGYRWMNKEGTGLIILFENSKVYEKQSIGNLK